MREPAFLRRYKDKWQEYEHMLFGQGRSKIDPDRLATLYIQLTDDLAYARTFYPKSQVVRYLNGLAARTYLTIYKNKRQQRSRLITFWEMELPLIMRRNHRQMLYAFLMFSFFFLLGAMNALSDNEFLRVVLGDSYVEMTIQNIEQGDPMAVYKQSDSFPMFIRIAFNNIQVAFKAFAYGIMLTVGTVYILFHNGVMLGAFLTFFHTRNLLWEALPVIYIHGTLEISAIVIAGGAGLMLGNSILFPGTYKRLAALQQAGKDGIKILIGLVPIFIMAAFLEGYVTRLTELPIWVKLFIIGLSTVFVLWYYLLYPMILERRLAHGAIPPDSART